METYRNPVWPRDFADPFVLRFEGDYYAYGTAAAGADGRIFPVLRSNDLANWEAIGGALEPLTKPAARSYWAPEVAEKEGRFYLYYSASVTDSDADQRLRVAVADRPDGPFRDSGKLLRESLGFSIDGSPFHDPRTGQWHLFFATDYLTEAPFGTGLGVIQLSSDMISTEGDPRVVVRASAEWQIYEKNRDYKGRVWPAWYCVEGPHVTFHAGKYYCFYSGGAWHGTEYGVGFAVADHPMGPWRDDFAAQGPVVLKGIPNTVVGPGHNSVVIGPDGKTHFMIYHAWDQAHTARRMCIDPIQWTENGPRVMGPSIDTRPLFPG